MSPQRVLVAEDDPGVRFSLEMMLTAEGFEVLAAADGVTALSLAKQAKPDAILLDHFMPQMSGRQVLEGLRSDASTSAIPVLVLTGMGREDPQDWPGAIFVGKPFTPSDLLLRLHQAMDGAEEGSSSS